MTWRRELPPAERIAFGASMLQKPYAKDALALIPKFVQKYQQVTFVARTTRRIKSGIVGFGKSALGDILRQ